MTNEFMTLEGKTIKKISFETSFVEIEFSDATSIGFGVRYVPDDPENIYLQIPLEATEEKQ